MEAIAEAGAETNDQDDGARRGVNAPEVVLVEGDDASGMAVMLGGLLEDNMRDFASRARVAARARGDVVLTAADRGVSVTLSFRRGRVEIRDGVAAGAPVVSGPWLAMTKLCSGQLSPVRAWREGELSLQNPRRAQAAAAAGFVLSVPSSFYGESHLRRNVTIASVGFAGAFGILAVVVIARRRARK